MQQHILTVSVIIILFDKPYHTDFISSADYPCHASKIHHKDIIFQVLDRDDMVMLLPFEAKKHPLEDNLKGHRYQYLPLIMKII